MVAFEAVGLQALAQSRNGLDFFDPAGSEPYSQGNGAVGDSQCEQGRKRQEPYRIGNPCLDSHHVVEGREQAVGKPDAGHGSDPCNPQKLEQQRGDQLSRGIAHGLPGAQAFHILLDVVDDIGNDHYQGNQDDQKCHRAYDSRTNHLGNIPGRGDQRIEIADGAYIRKTGGHGIFQKCLKILAFRFVMKPDGNQGGAGDTVLFFQLLILVLCEQKRAHVTVVGACHCAVEKAAYGKAFRMVSDVDVNRLAGGLIIPGAVEHGNVDSV